MAQQKSGLPWGVAHKKSSKAINDLANLKDQSSLPKMWRERGFDKQRMHVWLDEVVKDISDALWPMFNKTDSTQKGASQEFMDALTTADFGLMEGLTKWLETSISGRFATAIPHQNFFDDEDLVFLGQNYVVYDPWLPDAHSGVLQDYLAAGTQYSVGAIDIYLKDQFQRQRPYRAAFLMGISNFSYLNAKTAPSASLPSGHCIDGIMAAAALFVKYKGLEVKKRGSVPTDSLEILKQFGVDVGDRRVFAGVHYPSDNIASWYLALKIVPYVYEEKQLVHDFLCDSISKSIVYKAIRQHTTAEGSPYKRPMAMLDLAMAFRYP